MKDRVRRARSESLRRCDRGAARRVFALALAWVAALLWSSAAFGATPPNVLEVSVLDVAAGSATFHAQVDPEGSDTTYTFQYGTTTSYGASVPAPAADLGSGTEAVSVQVHVQGLQPDVTYHFRVLAGSAGGVQQSVDQTFTTQRAGGELRLPDGRQWELVSPPSKELGGIMPKAFNEVQAAEDGGAITYGTTAPITPEPPGSLVENTQIVSSRGPSGWSSQDISPSNQAIPNNFQPGSPQYIVFSSDLTQAVLAPLGEVPLAPGAPDSALYVRENTTDRYQAFANGFEFGGTSPNLRYLLARESNGSHGFSGESGLYEWSEGRSQLVSVLDGGGVCEGAAFGHAENMAHTVSDDGSRIIWESSCAGQPALYLRDTATAETVQLDAMQGGESQEGYSLVAFQTASDDGSKIFFTDSQRLVAGATAKTSTEGDNQSEPDLYECVIGEVAGKLACELHDLTVDHNPGESANVQGNVLGASENGSYVYFVATGALAAGAKPGHYNLYEWHEGELSFIAAMTAEDMPWAELRRSGRLPGVPARVSPNGHFLAFLSTGSPTGYDNRDARSGAPDTEVYLYDAGTNSLICASCNPTGARPDGVFDAGNVGSERALLVDDGEQLQGMTLAGSIPGWTELTLASSFYQSRYLSDEGRLFFDSADALVPQDTNGLEDVYEYEPAGVGSCTSADPGFTSRADGCVSLISSGTSSEESDFFDASASGSDVFFTTSEKLTQQDYDTSIDIYDAHVCSEAAPCRSTPVVPPACTTADACRLAPEPQPSTFGAPASSTFNGAGNLTPGVSHKSSKTKIKRAARRRHRKSRSRLRGAGRTGKQAGSAGRRARRSGAGLNSSTRPRGRAR